VTSLVAAVAPRTGKIIGVSFYLDRQSTVGNRVGTLEFTRTKNDFSERGLAHKGLNRIKKYFFVQKI